MKWLINKLSRVHFPYSVKKINKTHINEIKSNLKVGDIFFTNIGGYLINLFNISPMNHCAVYIGDNKVIEAVSEGVIETDLMYFLSRKDEIIVKRVTEQDRMPCFINTLKSYIGTKYDFEFEESDGQFYCFELVAISLKKSIKNIKILPCKIFGKFIFLSSSFENTFFNTIYKSRK